MYVIVYFEKYSVDFLSEEYLTEFPNLAFNFKLYHEVNYLLVKQNYQILLNFN